MEHEQVELPAFALKRCSACREIKPLFDFVRNSSARGGFGSYCKPCHNAISRRNRERIHGTSRNYLLKHRYGVDAEAIEEIWVAQGRTCAICRSRSSRHVDHDHGTQTVRGILCFSCNGALGQFHDDVNRLAEAIQYLYAAQKQAGKIGAEPEAFLCVVCRGWLCADRFENDHRRHRGRKQWCRDCGDARGRAAIERLSTQARRYHLLTKYGIDVHEAEELSRQQQGLCAICRSQPASQVDHDHRSGAVRGILCGGCNAGLGQFKEDPQIIRNAIAYLERWQKKPPDTVQEPPASYILSVA